MALRFRTLASSALLAAVALTGCDAAGVDDAASSNFKAGNAAYATDQIVAPGDVSTDKPSDINGPRSMRPGEACAFSFDGRDGEWSATGNLTIFGESNGSLKVVATSNKAVESAIAFTDEKGRTTLAPVSIDPNKNGDC